MKCKIRVNQEISGLFQEYQPKKGKVYEADYVPPYQYRGKSFKGICFINISGKRIVLREDEFEVVGGRRWLN